MATTQAFRNALHVPLANPNLGDAVVASTAGAAYASAWVPGPGAASGSLILTGSGVPADALGIAGNFYVDVATDHMYGPKAASGPPFWPDAINITATEMLAKINTVDGTGSGLDADMLDGANGTTYLDLANHTGNLDCGTF